jgi:glutaconate CoA-transferase, subunit A
MEKEMGKVFISMEMNQSKSKVMSLSEAIALIENGDSVAFGGMLIYRRPVAAAIEIAKQCKKKLTLMGWTLSIESDILIGMDCVDKVRTSYLGLETFGLAPMFRKKAESGDLQVIEETETTIGFGLRAAMQRISFLPGRSLIGTDLLKVRPDIQVIKCPYTDAEYPALPAWKPKVAIIHTEMSDSSGNSVISGNLCIDAEIAQLADITIITTEKIVDTSEIPSGKAHIIGSTVTAIAEVPNGSWPTSCYPVKKMDGRAIVKYIKDASTNQVHSFIEEYQIKEAGGEKIH